MGLQEICLSRIARTGMTARKTQQEGKGTRWAHGAERAEAKKVFDRFAETGAGSTLGLPR